MKHTSKITFIIIFMFLITQFIGLYVVSTNPFYITKEINGTKVLVSNPILSWINPPKAETKQEYNSYFGSIIFSFVLSIFIFLFLIKFKFEHLMKVWFYSVISVSLLISLVAIFPKNEIVWAFLIPFALFLSYIKTFKRNIIVHNITELFIYPGIACIFVPFLNFPGVILLLVFISIYDMWAVWHSGIMQKMAKFQMDKVKVFSGFFIPYISKKQFKKIKETKIKNNSNKKEMKIKTNVAILGGGDVVFPIITAGVVFFTKEFQLFKAIPPFIGGFIPSLFVIFGATLGLSLLLFFSQKKKFYPAMPFITSGILFGIFISYILEVV